MARMDREKQKDDAQIIPEQEGNGMDPCMFKRSIQGEKECNKEIENRGA